MIYLSQKYHAQLIIDEAHAVGLFGESGKGLCSLVGYENVYAVLVTFGKALGVVGAALLSSCDKKRDFMKEPMASLSTGLPPHTLVSIQVAYDFLSTEGETARVQLQRIREYFAQKVPAAAPGFVQPLSLPGVSSQDLYQRLTASGVRVGRSKEILRANLHAFNTEEEVDFLVSLLLGMADQKNVLTGSISTMQRTLEDNFAAANAS